MSQTTKYTLVDLEEERRWDGGNGPNNPGAWRRQLRRHNERLWEIEAYLRAQGVDTSPENSKKAWEEAHAKEIEADKERREIRVNLDAICPHPEEGQVVEYDGRQYKFVGPPFRMWRELNTKEFSVV